MKKFIICVVALAMLLVFELTAMGAAIGRSAETKAIDNAKYCSHIIGDKIEETLDLLTSLAATDTIRGDELSYKEKSVALTKISNQFGYMMIRIVDKDFWVYSETATSEDGRSSNLSRRDYLLELRSTLEPQVTDAFLAGADGKTVNFTIAVPIVKDGVFDGALFAAIYEKDFAKVLRDNGAILLGKKLQYMSGVDVEDVGYLLDEEFENMWLWGATAEERLVEIRRETTPQDCFWGMEGAYITAIAYNKVENAEWNVICKVTFGMAIADNAVMFSMMIISMAISLSLLIAVCLCRDKFYLTKEEASTEETTFEE